MYKCIILLRRAGFFKGKDYIDSQELISETDTVPAVTDNAVLQSLGPQIIVLSIKFDMDHGGKGKQNISIGLTWTSYFQKFYSFYSDEIAILILSHVKIEAIKCFSSLPSNFTLRCWPI